MTKEKNELSEEDLIVELFDEYKLKEIESQHPLIAIQNLCEELISFISSASSNNIMTENLRFAEVMKAFTFIQLFSLKHKIKTKKIIPSGVILIDTKSYITHLNYIKRTAMQLYSVEVIENSVERYSSLFNDEAIYELENHELQNLKNKISEIKGLIQKSNYLEINHRLRLLKQIEILQSELHKKMSDFSKFWGFVIESGIALGLFRIKARPLFDKVREMSRIISNIQTRTNKVDPKLIGNIFSNNLLEAEK